MVPFFLLFFLHNSSRLLFVKIDKYLLTPSHSPSFRMAPMNRLQSTLFVLSVCGAISHAPDVCVTGSCDTEVNSLLQAKSSVRKHVAESIVADETFFCTQGAQNNHNQLGSFRGYTKDRCMQECIANPKCLSFDSSANGGNECYLSTTTAATGGGLRVTDWYEYCEKEPQQVVEVPTRTPHPGCWTTLVNRRQQCV